MPQRSCHHEISISTIRIPLELLEEILLYQTPIFLITTCRQVSKTWNCLIETSTPLKYFSTTGLPLPNLRIPQKNQPKRELFTPVFLDILHRLWKRLAPLPARFREPVKSDDLSGTRRRDISIAYAKEIEQLYHRYNPIFSKVPLIDPVYRYVKSRISSRFWGVRFSRSDILDELDGQNEILNPEHKDFNLLLNLLRFLKSPPAGPIFECPNGMLIFLCRFVFTHEPYYSLEYGRNVGEIQALMRIKICCLPVGDEGGDAIQECRKLIFRSSGDYAHVPEVKNAYA